MGYRALLMFFAVSWLALSGVLGCGASQPAPFAAPPAGGVAPGEVFQASPVEEIEVEDGADDSALPPGANAQPARAGRMPKRLPGTNPVPDAAKYRSVRATIYGADWCGACHAAEKLLRSKGVKVLVKNIEKDPRALLEAQRKIEKVGQRRIRKIPIIDINGRIIVGYSRRAVERTLEKARLGRR